MCTASECTYLKKQESTLAILSSSFGMKPLSPSEGFPPSHDSPQSPFLTSMEDYSTSLRSLVAMSKILTAPLQPPPATQITGCCCGRVGWGSQCSGLLYHKPMEQNASDSNHPQAHSTICMQAWGEGGQGNPVQISLHW